MSLTASPGPVELTTRTGHVVTGDRGGDADRLRWLIRRIAADDRDAFGEFVHRVSGPVSRGLRGYLSDPLRVTGVVAGTFVEVWWLAGGHVDPDTDVIAWIDQIVRRRVHDSRPPVAGPADPAGSTADTLTSLWAQRAETELAGLLQRLPHRSDPSKLGPARRNRT